LKKLAEFDAKTAPASPVVKGAEYGGRVLPKEEVSDDVKAFLKTIQK
jgi:hypothetical protein